MTYVGKQGMKFEDALNLVNEVLNAQMQRQLTEAEIAILSGAWYNQTYEEVAQTAGYSLNYLQRNAAPKFWKLLSQLLNRQLNKTNAKGLLVQIAQQKENSAGEPQSSTLDIKGIQQSTRRAQAEQIEQIRVLTTVHHSMSLSSPQPIIDWGEAPDVSVFYGRLPEQEVLTQWIVQENCRLLAVLGMGGIGKSSLAAKIAYQVQDQFEFVIWRSLRNAPPLETLLSDLVTFLSQQQDTQVTSERLLHWLRQTRCLVILDNVETILQPGDRAGFYQPGYEVYGNLLRLLGESSHRSCVLLTSREKPTEISTFEAEDGRVRSLSLTGSQEAALALLESKSLVGTDAEKHQLCESYNCSPLALKIVAASIHSVFDREIAPFLEQETMVFNGLRRLLEQQFERLSSLEKTIMYWLAINREWTSITELVEDIVPAVSRASLLEALESLTWRSMVETRSGKYTQQSVVMEYVTNDFIQRIIAEINTLNLSLFDQFALLKTTVLDYTRESQNRLILQPLCEQLKNLFHSTETLKHHFQLLVQQMHHNSTQFFYGVGNCINLLLHLGIDLSSYDFSHFKIRQVDLQCSQFSRINLAYADLKDCRFTQTFGGIVAIALSPDNQILALGDSNATIQLWQTSARGGRGLVLDQPLIDLIGHTSWILSVAWQPDGRRLISSSDDQTIKLWDVQTGQCLRTFQGHQRSVWWTAWSPDETQIASSSGDQTIKIWDIATGTCLKTLHGHQNSVYCVAWSPDGKTLASSSEDQTVRLWDVQRAECFKIITIEGAWVRRVAWSPDGMMLASASADLQLWDGTGQLLRTLGGRSMWIDSLAWSPDGKTLASGSSDRTIKLWNPLTGECLHTLQGHQDLIWTLYWSADSKILTSGSHDQTIRLWNAETGQCHSVVRGYTNSIRNITWSPDSCFLASSSSDKTIRIWNVETGQCQKTLTGHQAWIYSIAWSPKPVSLPTQEKLEMIASSGADATIKLWNATTGHCVRTIHGHTAWVWSVAWSPDGRRLASGSSINDLSAKIWNPLTGECLNVLTGHKSWIWWVKWSPNGVILATAADDNMIKLWDGKTGDCLYTLHDDRLLGVAIAWSPDSQRLAASALGNVVRIWNVDTATWERELAGHRAKVWAVAWSPDGQSLASASDDGRIRIWNLETNKCRHVLWSRQIRIWDLAWSPDGMTLASSSLDSTIHLWNVHTGERLRVLRSDRPYEGMNITGVTGITEAQKATLKALGAIEE